MNMKLLAKSMALCAGLTAFFVVFPASAEKPPVPIPCDPVDCPPIDPCKINPDRCKDKGGPIKPNK